MKRLFVLYDGRAKTMGDEEADVLETADSEFEARGIGIKAWRNHDAVWYEYQLDYKGDLKDGKPRFDLPPNTVRVWREGQTAPPKSLYDRSKKGSFKFEKDA